MSGFRIRRLTRWSEDGWGWDLSVHQTGQGVEGEVFNQELNRGGWLQKQMPAGFREELEKQMDHMTPRPFKREEEWAGMDIARFNPGMERIYVLPRLKDCLPGSPEARIWELVNAIFDGYQYPISALKFPGSPNA